MVCELCNFVCNFNRIKIFYSPSSSLKKVDVVVYFVDWVQSSAAGLFFVVADIKTL